jgi:hypothetical protein
MQLDMEQKKADTGKSTKHGGITANRFNPKSKQIIVDQEDIILLKQQILLVMKLKLHNIA